MGIVTLQQRGEKTIDGKVSDWYDGYIKHMFFSQELFGYTEVSKELIKASKSKRDNGAWSAVPAVIFI